MKTINIYDDDYKILEKISNDNDIPVCEIIYILTEYIDEVKEDQGWI